MPQHQQQPKSSKRYYVLTRWAEYHNAKIVHRDSGRTALKYWTSRDHPRSRDGQPQPWQGGHPYEAFDEVRTADVLKIVEVQ